MDKPVTFATQRYNIQPIFFGVIWMVINLCCLATLAGKGGRPWQLVHEYGVCHSAACLSFQRDVALGPVSCHQSFAFIGMSVSAFGYASFFGFLVFPFAYSTLFHRSRHSSIKTSAILAPALATRWITGASMKLRNIFNVLALGTPSCYNGLRHGCLLLINSYCLEPVAATYCGRLVLYYPLVETIQGESL